MPYEYEYPRPAVSTDCVIIGFDGLNLNVLLIERGKEPFVGKWALPGGFLNMDETTGQCATRELKEETGIDNVSLEQIGTFSDVDRDPRGRVISVVYLGLVRMEELDPVAGDDAASVSWHKLRKLPPLAFDHNLVMRSAVRRMKMKARYEAGALEFLDEEFTLHDLRLLYEAIFDRKFDRPDFIRQVMGTGMYVPVEGKEGSSVADRLFRFDIKKCRELMEKRCIF